MYEKDEIVVKCDLVAGTPSKNVLRSKTDNALEIKDYLRRYSVVSPKY